MARIIARPEAERDLENIFAYVALASEQRAVRYILALQDQLDLLAATPLMGRSREEIFPQLRSFPFRRYLVFYLPLADGDGIEIVRVLHASRDVPHTLRSDVKEGS